MNRTPVIVFRTLLYGAIGLFGLAVAVGKMAGPTAPARLVSPAGLAFLPVHFLADRRGEARFVDATTGQIQAVRMPEGQILSYAHPAPWTDAEGRRQVVGRWAQYGGVGNERNGQSFGLARLELPGGAILDRIETKVLPSSHPCWLPDERPTVVFPSADGQLYRFAFASDDPVDATPCDHEPRPLRWEVPGMVGSLFVTSLSRPADPRLSGEGLLIASARWLTHDAVEAGVMPSTIWWLRLDQAGTKVVGAGPLVLPGGPAWDDDLTHPTLIRRSGRSFLAYLSRRHDESHWMLRVAPVEFGEGGRSPRPLGGPGIVLAEGCINAPPAFSPDARWASVIRETASEKALFHIDASELTAAPDASSPAG